MSSVITRTRHAGDAPMALRNASARTSVFFTSVLYTSDPTIGQKGTLTPSSCDTASASAVLPVPGAPTSKSARPANLRDLMRSTTTPHALEREHVLISTDMRERTGAYLACDRLADEPSAFGRGDAFCVETEAFDV